MPNSLSCSAVMEAAVALHVCDQEHVGAVDLEFEIVGNILAQDRRRERSEASRYLIFRLSVFCISGLRGSPKMERAPSAAAQTPCDLETNRRRGPPATHRSTLEEFRLVNDGELCAR